MAGPGNGGAHGATPVKPIAAVIDIIYESGVLFNTDDMRVLDLSRGGFMYYDL